jgi:hypothetical protein
MFTTSKMGYKLLLDPGQASVERAEADTAGKMREIVDHSAAAR